MGAFFLCSPSWPEILLMSLHYYQISHKVFIGWQSEHLKVGMFWGGCLCFVSPGWLLFIHNPLRGFTLLHWPTHPNNKGTEVKYLQGNNNYVLYVFLFFSCKVKNTLSCQNNTSGRLMVHTYSLFKWDLAESNAILLFLDLLLFSVLKRRKKTQ